MDLDVHTNGYIIYKKCARTLKYMGMWVKEYPSLLNMSFENSLTRIENL